MKLKDPVSSITHYIGLALSLLFGIPLIVGGFRVAAINGWMLLVFVLGLCLLYGASGTYHAIDAKSPRVNRILKKVDHCMIFVLIACSYTPICAVALQTTKSLILLGLVWAVALIGVTLKLFIIYHPKWISSVLYISMGWLSLILVVDIVQIMQWQSFVLLLLGGILYTIGGVLYALKWDWLENLHPAWGCHEIFHIFVMLGSLCHYLVMWIELT